MRRLPIRNFFPVALSALLLMLSFAFAEKQDRTIIAVATDGKNPTASVSRLAGRCPYYLLFDGRGVFLQAVENPFKSSRGGAGISAVDFLAQKGVKMIVAEKFGDRMISAMERRGIRHFEFQGKAENGLQQALKTGAVRVE